MNKVPSEILFWNRRSAKLQAEKVYGDALMRWLYGTRIGQIIVKYCLSQPWMSFLYGKYQSSFLSRRKIAPFIQTFQIAMDEFEPRKYLTFNDFFIRKFKIGARKFSSNPLEFSAFAEARYLAFNAIDIKQSFPVKGRYLSAEVLLGCKQTAQDFIGGPLLLARLCPTDYHRFHFPDAGHVLKHYTLHGKLHSVNPLALQYKGDIFATNERQVTLLQTQNFGKLAYIEVGALCVGKIVQTYTRDLQGGSVSFQRGDEKGYFLFGASTVIVMGERGRWMPDEDLLFQTRTQQETLVQLGEKIASRQNG